MGKKVYITLCLIILILTGCIKTVRLREALIENIKIPPGRIEGNKFIGIRYPFKVEVPDHWKLSIDFPDFLKELGYEKPSLDDKEQTELYIYNPETRSSIQFDFTPAGQYTEFSQELIEGLTTIATDSLMEELRKEHGKEIELIVSSTKPIHLKGVKYAAKKYAIYSVNGEKREQRWIYGYKVPYQIFILYMIIEKEGFNDRKDIDKIFDKFEVFQK